MPEQVPLPPDRATSEPADRAAARWALRLAEGLTPEQEAELADWLAADPRHVRLLAEYRRAWDRFTPLATATATAAAEPNAGRFAPRSRLRRVLWLAGPALAAAALIAFGFWWRSAAVLPAARTAPIVLAPIEQRQLLDGSAVELNRGAEIAVAFTPEVRQVELVRGEATFNVAKNPERPFVVAAGSLRVRAVGTAFNVRRSADSVEVLVTEGVVSIEPAAGMPAATGPLRLGAGQQVVVPGAAPVAPPPVATLSPEEIDRRLAWQSRLLEFDDAPLAEIVAAFNRRNPVALVVDDPALAALRMTATFRSDNVDSFVRLLEANFGLAATPRADGSLVLSPR